jgi:hypothetical protein
MDITPRRHDSTDRTCENCGRDWRGSEECPVCMHVTPDEDGILYPFAVRAFEWPGIGTQYTIFGGPRHRSTVGAETLRALGMAVPR